MQGLAYEREPVDQLEHARQGARLERGVGRGPDESDAHCGRDDRELAIAALLHDVARSPAVAGIAYDGPREHQGLTAARCLEPRLGARVAWLAEQHVSAKRFLTTIDDTYLARLTEVSAGTLIARRGAMTDAEVPKWPLSKPIGIGSWRSGCETSTTAARAPVRSFRDSRPITTISRRSWRRGWRPQPDHAVSRHAAVPGFLVHARRPVHTEGIASPTPPPHNGIGSTATVILASARL